MGVFSAIYLTVLLTVGMISTFGPIFMLVGWVLCILINGVVVMLYLKRTPITGTFTALGLFVGGLYVIMGSFWFVIIGMVILGILCDAIVWFGSPESNKNKIFAYGVFSMWYINALFPIFFNSENYFKEIARYTNNQAYADQMQQIFTPASIVVIAIVLFVVGCIGGWLGTNILSKHFVKAGIA